MSVDNVRTWAITPLNQSRGEDPGHELHLLSPKGASQRHGGSTGCLTSRSPTSVVGLPLDTHYGTGRELRMKAALILGTNSNVVRASCM